ncbi:hypothetical protein GCM10011415_03960 [Salipiger pallidus]|uniref:Uncharacterized protein n=1 Tax=Salipiger pallidus TaxID=1775170 RepID=A0A8J2ZGU9_9RHOB|nr:hypothetical protein GCM10011415_03960 [Salipiger pallidus]
MAAPIYRARILDQLVSNLGAEALELPGATDRLGQLSRPLRDTTSPYCDFGVVQRQRFLAMGAQGTIDIEGVLRRIISRQGDQNHGAAQPLAEPAPFSALTVAGPDILL